MKFGFLRSFFASGLFQDGLGSLPEKYVAREKKRVLNDCPPVQPIPPPPTQHPPSVAAKPAILEPVTYRWTYPLTFNSLLHAPMPLPPRAIEQPAPLPGPYTPASARRRPWLPKPCIYKGRAAYWSPGEAWTLDQLGLWLPADDIAVMFFGAFVTPGEFIRTFPNLPQLPDEAFCRLTRLCQR